MFKKQDYRSQFSCGFMKQLPCSLTTGDGRPTLSLLSVIFTISSPPPSMKLTNLGVYQPTVFADTPVSLQILNFMDRSSGDK
jgi:hypothetical protein